MSTLPTNPSESTKRRNPTLYASGKISSVGYEIDGPAKPVPNRIRQDSKPLMNKLEQEWFNILSVQFPNYPRPRAQAVTFKLANGVRYTPDVFATSWPGFNGGPSWPAAWEVKGKHAWDDSLVKLKVAAHEWPDVQWMLCWKVDGEWKQQEILP